MTPVRAWFLWVARAEGLSLLALFGIAMPLKYAAGMPEATAWVGWLHGVLVFLYLIALGSVTRAEQWSWKCVVFGFVASLLPAGTFFFERRIGGSEAG